MNAIILILIGIIIGVALTQTRTREPDLPGKVEVYDSKGKRVG